MWNVWPPLSFVVLIGDTSSELWLLWCCSRATITGNMSPPTTMVHRPSLFAAVIRYPAGRHRARRAFLYFIFMRNSQKNNRRRNGCTISKFCNYNFEIYTRNSQLTVVHYVLEYVTLSLAFQQKRDHRIIDPLYLELWQLHLLLTYGEKFGS